jgi:GntR family transcriptional regulator, transcriptional repressor for pyruvate dehydrogenase complex
MRDLERDYRTPDTTAAELVVNFVRGQIERGQLRRGDRLPAERQLAARVGVSRPSVRAGLRTLAAMGVVQTRHGSGTYITESQSLDAKPLRMLAALHGFGPEQIFEARRMLELGVAGLAAERATSDQMAQMAEEVTGMFAAVDDLATFMTHDVHFHRAVAVASGNPILAALVEMVSALHFEQRRRAIRTRDQLRDVAITHRNIYHAVLARDPERARREMSQHLPRMRPVAVAAEPRRKAVPVAVAGR